MRECFLYAPFDSYLGVRSATAPCASFSELLPLLRSEANGGNLRFLIDAASAALRSVEIS